jgi:hypothetical protein
MSREAAFLATGALTHYWIVNSVSKEQKSEREKNNSVRSRQRAIGRELRRMYDDIAKEPVPDDFLDLLRKIDNAGGEGGNPNS